jgi:hypothetical protein
MRDAWAQNEALMQVFSTPSTRVARFDGAPANDRV